MRKRERERDRKLIKSEAACFSVLFYCEIWYEVESFKWHMTDDNNNDNENAAQIYTCR